MASASLHRVLEPTRERATWRAASGVPTPDAPLVPRWRWSAAAPTVLQLVPELGDSEPARASIDCARGVAESGGTALVASAGGRLTHVLDRHACEPVAAPLAQPGRRNLRRATEQLGELCRRRGVGVLHARSPATARVGQRLARALGIPLVTSAHETFAPTSFWQRRQAAPIAAGDRVTAVSAYVAHRLQTHLAVPGNRLRHIPGGLDTDTLDPQHVSPQRIIQVAERWNIPDDRRIVLLPAPFEPGHGHRLLLRALSRLVRADFSAVLLGGGDSDDKLRSELALHIESAGLGDRVQLIDGCTDMAAAYMLADVVCATATRPRAFDTVAVAAQAMGRPVVVADHGGAPESLRRGYTGWLVPPGDPGALAATLDQALDLDSDTRAWLGSQARAHVLARHDRRLAVRRLLAVYDELLAHPGDSMAGQAHYEALLGDPAAA